MSIILKGIDMPKENETRMIAITSNGVAFFNTVKEGETSKSEKTEAIQIPKDHGNIIDESKAVVTETIDGYYEITAPTILKGEER